MHQFSRVCARWKESKRRILLKLLTLKHHSKATVCVTLRLCARIKTKQNYRNLNKRTKVGSIKSWLQSLSFRTGVIVLLCCIPFYILSFAQMLLPISATAKGVLWTILFGLAKTCQYGGLTILGVEGFNRLKRYWTRKASPSSQSETKQRMSVK